MAKLLLSLNACAAFVFLSLLGTPAAAQKAQDWPRLDLTLLAGATLASADADRVDPIGLSLGATGIVRVDDLLGIGLVLEHHVFGWQAAGASGPAVNGSAFPDDDGSISYDLALLAARLYFLELGPADLLAQLGLGYGALTYAPDHPDCDASDGFAAQLVVGAEWRLSRSLGIHSSVAAWPFGWGLGCNEISYTGKPPPPPWPNLGLGARIGFTSVWD